MENKQQFCTDLCPHCETEVSIPTQGLSKCPNCQETILPCSQCTTCENCPYIGYDTPTRELGLSVRPSNCLLRNQKKILGDITVMTREEFYKLNNLSQKGADEIQKMLNEKGFAFRNETTETKKPETPKIWYELTFEPLPDCTLHDNQILKNIQQRLRDLNVKLFDENLKVKDWGFWPNSNVQLKRLSKSMLNVVITLSTKSKDSDYWRHYFCEGFEKSVQGHVTYPPFVKPDPEKNQYLLTDPDEIIAHLMGDYEKRRTQTYPLSEQQEIAMLEAVMKTPDTEFDSCYDDDDDDPTDFVDDCTVYDFSNLLLDNDVVLELADDDVLDGDDIFNLMALEFPEEPE